RSVRLSDARGTDLRLRVPDDAWFHKNDGDMSPARAAAGRSVRDREMEFPSGALRFIPDVSSTEGRLVVTTPVPRTAASPPEADVITLEFERGRVVRQHAAKDNVAFARMWTEFGGDIDKVGEIVIGTNPLLAGTLPSGARPYYGYGAGHVRVSMGDNWESGGTNRSPAGRPLWLFLDKPTVESAGRGGGRFSRGSSASGSSSARPMAASSSSPRLRTRGDRPRTCASSAAVRGARWAMSMRASVERSLKAGTSVVSARLSRQP